MVATFLTARDEIQSIFKVTWDADTPAITGGAIPKIFFEGVGEKDFSPSAAPWARISIRHTLGEQATLSDENGKRRFEKFGIVTVQIFVPLKSDDVLTLFEQLAQVGKKAFEGEETTTSNIWFQNVRINEVGVDDPWFQVNVVAEFRYDELI